MRQPLYEARAWPIMQPSPMGGGSDFGMTRGYADGRGLDPLPPEDPGPGFLTGAWDVTGGAVLRGTEGFVRGVIGAADWVLQDALPDSWSMNRWTGEASTAVGGFLDEVVSFAWGFVPVAGWLGKGAGVLSKANQASKATKLGRFGIAAARDAAAGAAVDFTLYDRQEARYAAIAQKFPEAEPHMQAYLAEQIDDSELAGRLGQVATGAVLGLGVDGLAYGLKALRAARKAKAAGLSPDKVEEAVQTALAKDAPPGLTPQRALEVDGTERAFARNVLEGSEDLLEVNLHPRRPAPPEGSVAAEGALAGRGGVADSRQLNLEPFAPKGQGKKLDLFNDQAKLHRAVELEMLEKLRANPHLAQRTEGEMVHEARDMALRDLGIVGESDVYRLGLTYAARIADETKTRAGFDAFVLGARAVYKAQLTDLHARKKLLLAADTLDEAEVERWAQDLSSSVELIESLLGYQSQGGRFLRSLGFKVKDLVKLDPKRAKEALVNIDVDPAKPAPIRQLTFADRFFGVTNEFFVNSILSGMRTLSISVLSPTALSIYNPAERLLGGVARAFRERSTEPLAEAFRFNADTFKNPAVLAELKKGHDQAIGLTDHLRGFALNILEASKFAVQSWRKNDALFAPGTSFVDDAQRHAISSAYMGLNPDGVAGRFIDQIGRIVRLPTRMMTSADEFFKQLNGRGIMRAQLYREARKQGIESREIDAWVNDRLEQLIVDGQLMTKDRMEKKMLAEMAEQNFATEDRKIEWIKDWWDRNWSDDIPVLLTRALDGADQVTMTGALESGTLSKSLQDIAFKHPYLRLIVPFIRTPTNLFKWSAIERNPIAQAAQFAQFVRKSKTPEGMEALAKSKSRLIRDLLSGDSVRRTEAYGRVAAAVGWYTAAVTLLDNTQVTGNGPMNPALRKAWLAAGNQPYSFKVGDRWVSYGRLDPFATIIGMVADFKEHGRWAPADAEDGIGDVATTLMVAIASNITNKTYLTGLTEAMEVITEPGKYGERWIARYMGAAVPNFFAQIGATADPVLRDAQSIMDRFANRIPGWGAYRNDPQRNVLGEAITKNEWLGPDFVSPIAYTEVKDNVIFEEMILLKRGFQPPTSTRNGLEYRDYQNTSGQSAYDRWVELSGQIRLDGMGLKDALRKVIKSEDYQALSPIPLEADESPRVSVLKRVISTYQRAAHVEMLREFPDLQRDINAQRQLRLQRRSPGLQASAPASPSGPRLSPGLSRLLPQ